MTEGLRTEGEMSEAGIGKAAKQRRRCRSREREKERSKYRSPGTRNVLNEFLFVKKLHVVFRFSESTILSDLNFLNLSMNNIY